MIIDGRTLPEGEVIETDVCVVGAGPVGLTLARELAGQPFRVCLLESGGAEFSDPTQALSEGEVVGDPIESPGQSRRRQLGGTAHVWNSQVGRDQAGFRCGTLDQVDFEQRDWLPESGWPFDKSHLDPFYERAQAVCGLGPYAYGAQDWADEQAPELPFAGDAVTTNVWQFGTSQAFTSGCVDEIKRVRNITTLLYANVVEIETNEAASAVRRLRVATLEGGRFSVTARLFILAAGGIENVRLLLLSNSAQKEGLGNHHDLVGRFFMDHPYVRVGTFTPADRRLFNRTALYDLRPVNGSFVMGKLAFSDEALRREQLLNFAALLLPQRHKRYRPEAVDSLRALISSGLRLKVPADAGGHLSNLVKGLDFIALTVLRKATGRPHLVPQVGEGGYLLQGGWSALPGKERRYSAFDVFAVTEQAPDPANRVTLTDQLDELGCRRVRLEWRWRERDTQSVIRAQELLAKEVARAGLGDLRIELAGGAPAYMHGLHHHMGTTRMHRERRRGVVDENCKVHGIGNLFVTGCSVFPTAGYINPTLTIVALAIRLADHVKKAVADFPAPEA